MKLNENSLSRYFRLLFYWLVVVILTKNNKDLVLCKKARLKGFAMLKCFYHPDQNAIVSCQQCKRNMCLEDTYIFIDQHKDPKTKLYYCELCYNQYYKSNNKDVLVLLTFLTLIGSILVIRDFYERRILGISFVEIVGWLTILSSLAIFIGMVKEYKVRRDTINDYELKIAKVKGLHEDQEEVSQSLVCTCGKVLLPSDSFCQNCGRITEDEQRRQWDAFDIT